MIATRNILRALILVTLALLSMACARPDGCVLLDEQCAGPVMDEIRRAQQEHGSDPAWPAGIDLSVCDEASEISNESDCLTFTLGLSADIRDYREWQAAVAAEEAAEAAAAEAEANRGAGTQTFPGGGFTINCSAELEFGEPDGNVRMAGAIDRNLNHVFRVIYREGTEAVDDRQVEVLSTNLARDGRDVETETVTLQPNGHEARLTRFVSAAPSGRDLSHAVVAFGVGSVVFAIQVTTGDAATASRVARQVGGSLAETPAP